MIEKDLDEFEDFYKEQLNSQFYKIKKYTNKYLQNIRESLIEIKVCLDHFLEAGKEKIEQKSKKSLKFFSDRIRKEINEIQIPNEEVNYDNILDLLNSLKRLFTSINEIARKSLPKFHKEVQSEIKELNYLTRKLGKKQAQLDQFMRKKYTDLREAEYLLKKLPKLFHLKENIENAKVDLDEFEKELEERKTKQEELNSALLTLENNELFKELEAKKEKLFKMKISINDEISFKKALKKFKFEVEKGTIPVSNIDTDYLRDFLKSPIRMLTNERKDLPKFTGLMVHLRHALEENKLNLKSETKQKTIEQINAIFDEKLLQNNIEDYLQLKEDIKRIEKTIEKEGLKQKQEDLKSEISSNTVKLEHIEVDYDRKNKDYTRYLSTLKSEREEFQNLIEEVLDEEIKIVITFSF